MKIYNQKTQRFETTQKTHLKFSYQCELCGYTTPTGMQASRGAAARPMARLRHLLNPLGRLLGVQPRRFLYPLGSLGSFDLMSN